MQVFIVTTKSEERNSSGVLLRATANLHGIYTSEAIADGMVTKYNGTKTSVYLDDEQSKKVLQTWVVNL